MAKNTTLAAGTSPFAHLLGGAAALAGRALGKRAEEETPVDEDGPTDPDDADDPESVDDPEDVGDGAKKGRRGKKAKGETEDGDEPDAEDEDDTDPDAEDDDADEPEGKKAATPYQRGYAAANKRARAIFASPAAAGRPDLAAQLAFGTNMSAPEAVGVMATVNTGAPKGRSRLDDRMANRAEPRPGAGGGTTGKASFADRVAAAVKKAGR